MTRAANGTEHADVQRYDVVVIGGGLVGATLACALGQHQFKVALIDTDQPALTWPVDTMDLRVSAISPASQELFDYLGVWNEIRAQGAFGYERMHVWDSQSPAAISFDSAAYGLPGLGHIIENRVIRAALWRRLEDWRHVRLHCPVAVTRIKLGDPVEVHLSNGGLLHADLVVGADGGLSRVRLAAEINAVGWSYEQRAVVANVYTELPHQHTAWQRFLPNGPLAFLPMAMPRCSIVWTTTLVEANQLMECDDAGFNARLEAAFARRLGTVQVIGQRVSFPLRLHHATNYVRHRVALVGDAAHVVHPLAGQGVNLGLLDAAVLVDELVATRDRHRDIGSLTALRRYERARKGDNLLRALSFDGMNHLFSNAHDTVRQLRAFGVNTVDRNDSIKQFFMEQALSSGGKLPSRFRFQFSP